MKKCDNNKCWRESKSTESYTLFEGVQFGVATLENDLILSFEAEHSHILVYVKRKLYTGPSEQECLGYYCSQQQKPRNNSNVDRKENV